MGEALRDCLSAAIQRGAEALATDPALAEQLAREVLKVAPADPRAGLILGSARRRLADPAGARAILEPLAKAYPRAANTQYELGATLGALGERASAIAALRQATALNRELPEAWRALGDQLFAVGDVGGAEAAYAEHQRAAVGDPALRPAADALFEGRLVAAEGLLRDHVKAHPGDVVGLRMLGEVFSRISRHGDAEILFARCLELLPSYDGARFGYANALFQQQKAAQAVPQVEYLLARDAADPAYQNLMAACLGLVGDFDGSIGIYQGLLAVHPKQPRIWLNYGHALRTIGRREEAVTAYKRCIALAPGIGDAYWSLANLKVASFTAEDETAMNVQLARTDLTSDDRLHLHYALGKALEDRGAYAASFEHYATGAKIRRLETPYDADEAHANIRRSVNLYTEELFTARAGHGSGSDDPIFIVGLPRSGSTLIEQILASHSAVEGTMELPDIGFIAASLGPRYPEILADLDAGQLAALGDSYIASTRIHRKLGRPLFIDKMPNNFHHVGLIHLILPNAKIIDARRHPLGACFSGFKQHFAQGQSFTYDLTDLGRYYRDYVELMGRFDAAVPGRVHRVIYEDLVDDTEARVRRLLDYCGLPFEAGCLKFYDNDRAVRTVSSEQVRRPIFREGLDQWRRYEAWLGPLKAALGPALEGWRG